MLHCEWYMAIVIIGIVAMVATRCNESNSVGTMGYYGDNQNSMGVSPWKINTHKIATKTHGKVTNVNEKSTKINGPKLCQAKIHTIPGR